MAQAAAEILLASPCKAPVAAVSMNSQKITNLANGTNSADAVNYGQLLSAVAALEWKDEAQASTTANLTATYSNGTSGVGATLTNSGTQAAFAVDGYTASLNDRILVQNQTTQTQNGIYTVTTVGSGSSNWVLTRAVDANTPAALDNATLYVTNGTTQAGIAYTQTTVNPTIGTNNIVFVKAFAGTSYTAGSGLTLTGSVFSIPASAVTNAMLANSSVTVTAGTGMSGGGAVPLGSSVTLTNAGVTSAVAGTGIGVSGATGAVTITNSGVTSNVAGTGISVSGATGAVTVTNTGVTSIVAGTGISVSGATGAVTVTNAGVNKYAATIGDGSTTAISVTHNLGTLDTIETIYQVSGGAEVECDVTHSTTNVTIFTFATAPASNSLRVVIHA